MSATNSVDLSVIDENAFDDLFPQQIEIKLGGQPHTLKEASVDAACKYRNALMRGTKMQDGKVSGVEGLADAEPLLVSLCLFKVVTKAQKNGDNTTAQVPVGLAEIRTWKSEITKKLFDKIKSMSPGLDETETEEALEKRIADAQAKLDKIRNEDSNDTGTLPNSSNGTTATSSSPTN